MKWSGEQENSNWSFLVRIAGEPRENLTTKMTALKYFIQQELKKREREQLQKVFAFSKTWMTNFEPKQGSEDAGVCPTIIFPNDTISM